jgi:hypothetical protein
MLERCDHCRAMQAASQAWLAGRGFKSWIEWGAAFSKPEPPPFRYTGDVPLATCPCECHSGARITGTLPRL